MVRIGLLVALVAIACATVWAGSVDDMKIQSLPGWSGDLPFDMWSGYVNFTSNNADKKYFFWFIQSPQDSSSTPVQLWLNGGPGCSSLTGLMTEHGPFRAQKNHSIELNPYSWCNDGVNMLYLESPAGVGFSECHGSNEDCAFDDERTAADNYLFLQNWVQLFSDFQGRDLVISGESYAGNYVPELADLIVEKPIDGFTFVGFMAGNPVTDSDIDNKSFETYVWSHALGLVDGDGTNQLSINPYDILVDLNPNCPVVSSAQFIRWPHPLNGFTWSGADEHLPPHHAERYVPNGDPCYQEYCNDYMNQREVQDAIHAPRIDWQPCGGVNYEGGRASVIPLYQKFLNSTNLVIMMYSGDADSVVNFIGTERCILNGMGVRPVDFGQWMYTRPYNNPWDPSVPQMGGVRFRGEGVSFEWRSVKGAGHMVPTFQPAPAQQLHLDFLKMLSDAKKH